MVPMHKVEEVISFLVGATGVGEWVALVVVMLLGVGANVDHMIVTMWMGEDEGVDVLTTEEMLVTGVEAEVTVAALKEFEHGIIAAGVAAGVGVGAGVGAVVEAEAGLVVGVAVIAVALAGVAAAAIAVAVAVEVTVAVEAPAMIDVTGQINRFLI